MYCEENYKKVTLEEPLTVGNLIEALKAFPKDALVHDTPISISYDLWSNEDSDRVRQGYKEYKFVTIE